MRHSKLPQNILTLNFSQEGLHLEHLGTVLEKNGAHFTQSLS